MRAQGGDIVLPYPVGTAIQWPSDFPKYSAALVGPPFCAMIALTTSSTGSRFSAWPVAYQLVNCRTSWPDFACASAAMVNRSLSPFEVMKSTVMSTFSFAAHSRHSCSRGAVAFGTQWSQKPQESLPAAKAPCTNGAATAVEANAAVFNTERRVSVEAMIVPRG